MSMDFIQCFRLPALFVVPCVLVPQDTCAEEKYRIVAIPKVMGLDYYDATAGRWRE